MTHSELATDLERNRSKCIHDYNYLKTGHAKNQEPEIRKGVIRVIRKGIGKGAFHERNEIGKRQRFYETTIQFNQPPVEFSEVIDFMPHLPPLMSLVF